MLSVYAAGLVRTAPAAAALAARGGTRRPAPPQPVPPASVERPASAPSDTAAGAVATAPPAVSSRSQPLGSSTRPAAPERDTAPSPPAPAAPPRGTPSSASVVATAQPSGPTTVTSPLVPPATAPAAPPPVPAPATPTPPPTTSALPPSGAGGAPTAAVPAGAKWKDGTYTGWGSSRHGDIEATVIIEGGRISAAAISRCLTRYSCSWIAHLQPQVAERQSPEIDNVSGATESANAFYFAVVDALKAAKP